MANFTFPVEGLLGKAEKLGGALLPWAERFKGLAIGDGMAFSFAKGFLAGQGFAYLTFDLLLEGDELAVFMLELAEGEKGAKADFHFGLLNWCEARARVPLSFVNQNRWMFEREGAWLKPLAGGQGVDLRNVDRMTLTVMRMGGKPVVWSMTPVVATDQTPAKLAEPRLPKGAIMDELGQSALHDWPAKTRSVAEMTGQLQEQAAAADKQAWPQTFSRWGGWKDGPRQKASGYFRTHHDGRRWWLVDPEGYLFWSAGMDCVRLGEHTSVAGIEKAAAWLPKAAGEFADSYRERGETKLFSPMIANFIRAFGKDWHRQWARIALGQLKSFGINTMANWSEWEIARAAGFPYVRPLNEHFATTPLVFRDFPDVFHPNFAADCAAYAEQLKETLGDPALVGYFLMNEPTWGFSPQTPALGMLYNNEASATRTALAEFLRKKYGEKLAGAWGAGVTYARLERGIWTERLNEAAVADLEAFSTVMVDRLFRSMAEACKKVDPDHLNLGARYYTVPPAWCLEGMGCFDVFGLNAYAQRIPAEKYLLVAEKLKRPLLAGEWHFGALDVGLPASGIGHVPTQADRGKAYRVYLETAGACPACIGVHYFQMYDQAALGRYDGENYNIGFVDVCGKAYAESAEAARVAHERMYRVAAGLEAATEEAPEYLPLLFM